MKIDEAKDGISVEGRGITGILFRNVNGWDVVSEKVTMQSVDLSEFSVIDKVPHTPGEFSKKTK